MSEEAETPPGGGAETTTTSPEAATLGSTTPVPIEREHSLSHVVPVYVITAIFGAIFIFVPLLVRRGPNKALTRTCIMLTAACCWIFYLTTYIVQMNPLLGPRMTNVSLAWIGYKWGNDPKTLTSSKSPPSSADTLKEDIEGPDELTDEDFRLPTDTERKLEIDARTDATTATAIAATAERLAQERATEEVLEEAPSEEAPPAEPLPAESPPADFPPADFPPAELPPKELPLAELPPPELPPVEPPPKEAVPAEIPPTELPPAEIPPIELPPAEPLPAESLPVELPPAEPIPAESPPVEPSPEERLSPEPETGGGEDDDGRI